MPNISPRDTFNRHLQVLVDQILVLGSMVETAILLSMDALRRRDLAVARQIVSDDQIINEKRYKIETECLTLIATQQPMARDLRFLAAILEIITELERMGDYGKGIARINLMLADEPFIIPLNDLQEMAERGLDMLKRALQAFINHDAEIARSIPLDDQQVDQLYTRLYHVLIQKMIENPVVIDHANRLMWAAHNLERMADRVTNICERIVFVVTGEMGELDVTDDELKGLSEI
jgi:phosphate transport system protein